MLPELSFHAILLHQPNTLPKRIDKTQAIAHLQTTIDFSKIYLRTVPRRMSPALQNCVTQCDDTAAKNVEQIEKDNINRDTFK